MNRVTVTNPCLGITGMQVCAISDASDDEILEVANRENPSGTMNGWTDVVRKVENGNEKMLPVSCSQEPGRIHLIVTC